MVEPTTEIANKLDGFFQEAGFFGLADTKNGIPSLGINQVYYKNESQFVMVKYGIRGDVVLNKLILTPRGFLIHKQVNNEIYMMYFRGFTAEYVNQTILRMEKNVSHLKILKNIIFPTAFADDCSHAFGKPILDQATQLDSISAAAAWDSLKTCMNGVGEGVVDSTIGVVKSVGAELGSFISHPIDYVENVADKVELFLVKTAKFIKGLITNPEETLKAIGKGFGKSWDTVVATVSNMTTEMKINFVCSFIGAIGVDAAIAFFTGGAASEKVILTINNVSRKFSMVEKIMSVISKFSSTSLNKFKLQSHKLEKFMKGLFHNHFPEQDLKHLDDLAHMSDELSLRTMSCYIR